MGCEHVSAFLQPQPCPFPAPRPGTLIPAYAAAPRGPNTGHPPALLAAHPSRHDGGLPLTKHLAVATALLNWAGHTLGSQRPGCSRCSAPNGDTLELCGHSRAAESTGCSGRGTLVGTPGPGVAEVLCGSVAAKPGATAHVAAVSCSCLALLWLLALSRAPLAPRGAGAAGLVCPMVPGSTELLRPLISPFIGVRETWAGCI